MITVAITYESGVRWAAVQDGWLPYLCLAP
jgi:hypothetical protein